MTRPSAHRPSRSTSSSVDEPFDARQRRATLQDVAREAGVSPITVWRALNQPQVVSERTVGRVQRAVEATGYVPNAVARSLVSSRSHTIAAVVPSVANWMFADVIQGMADHLHGNGYELLLACSNYDPAIEEQVARAIIGRQPDGLVLTGRLHTPATRRLVQRASLPVVEIWDHGEDPIDMSVGFSNREIGAAVARYLAGRGYRRLAFLNIAGRDRGEQRLAGFLEAVAESGLDPAAGHVCDVADSLEGGGAGAAALLEGPEPPDAVFVNGDMVAVGLLLECQRRGVQVPADLAVVGLGDLEIASHVMPALTTVRVPRRAVGEEAAGMLLRRLDAEAALEGRRIDLGFEIVERRSA